MSFDRLAPHYRWMEAVAAGSLLQRCRTAFVDDLASATRVLLLGEGRGRFLAALVARNPRVHVTVVDASARMLQLSRRDLVSAGQSDSRVTFVHGDALRWDGGGGAFDGVASHFFLDCFRPEQLTVLAAGVAAWTRPGVPWLVTDFRVPADGWRRWRAKGIHALMYGAFRMATDVAASHLTPPDPYLAAAGFDLRRRVLANCGLLHADVWVKGGHP